jgi:putative transposase
MAKLQLRQLGDSMTRSRYRIFENQRPYFLTCTIVAWLPVFTRPETVGIVLDSWRFLQSQGRLVLFGYVILDNHLHMVAGSDDLSKTMQSFKSYTARQILDHLEAVYAKTLLEELRYFKARHKIESTYQLWQEGSHPQQISDDEMMRQKLEYTHYNPVKRGYVDDPVHWRYSSARNYAGLPGLIEVETRW